MKTSKEEKMNNFYVYILRRPDKLLEGKPQPFYVGKGSGHRVKAHFWKCEEHVNPYKTAIIHKLQEQGLEVIVEKVLEKVTEEEAFKEEIRLIALYGRHNNGTGILANLVDGGGGVSGFIVTDEYRKKMSESCKGKIVTEETRRKQSASLKGEKNGFYGKKHTEAQKKAISDSLKGENNVWYGKVRTAENKKQISATMKKRYETQPGTFLGKHHTEESKEKNRRSNIGRVRSDETKAKMGVAGKGRVFTEEHKRKIAESNTGWKQSEETKEKMRRIWAERKLKKAQESLIF